MSKKGFIGDMLLYVIYIFAIAIMLFVVYYSWGKINTAWQADGNLTSESRSAMANITTKFNTWTWIVPVMVIGLAIAIILMAFLIPSHPAFAIPAILVLLIIAGVSIYMANTYYTIVSDAEFAATANTFSLTTLIMNNLPKIVIAIGIIFIIVMFAKGRSNSFI